MTYEDYLDEVTTLIYETWDVPEPAAIKWVMRAQAEGMFEKLDDDPSLLTQENALADAQAIYEARQAAKGTPSRKQ